MNEIEVTHRRVRWTSQHGVEFVSLLYKEYPASQGYTDIRYAYVDPAQYDVNLELKPNYSFTRIAKDAGATLALNGPPVDEKGQPLGTIVREGTQQQQPQTDKWADFMLDRQGRASIGQLQTAALGTIQLAFASTPQLVKGGRVYVNVHGEQTPQELYIGTTARSGLGITTDHRLLIVVADGDGGKYDAGLRADELAAVMVRLGAQDALHLGQGQATTLWHEGKTISANPGLPRQGSTLLFTAKSPKDAPPGYHYRKAYIRPRPNNRPGNKMIPKYLMIHTTNNFRTSATAEMHRRYLNTTQAYVSFHLVTDQTETIELIPLDEQAYHAGDGAGPFNTTAIGHEICVNALTQEGRLDPVTYRHAVEASAQVMCLYDVELVQHRDVPSRATKNCPHENVLDFHEFKQDVLTRLAELRENKKLEKSATALYKVQTGAFQHLQQADQQANLLRERGFNAYIVKEVVEHD